LTKKSASHSMLGGALTLLILREWLSIITAVDYKTLAV